MTSREAGPRETGMGHAPYDSAFFDWLDETGKRSARVIAPLVLEWVPAASVVDVGCGRGAWLCVFRELGVSRVLGVDGDYVDRGRLAIAPSEFVAHDLTTPLELDERFDLVVSLEVAEHLPAASASQFVDTLTSLGDVVLFSAAIPSQGGTNHVNERWPEYWASLFAERGFAVIDGIRPLVWDDPDVEVWYAQNTLLFASHPAIRANPKLRRLAAAPARPLSIVHPRLFLGPRRYALRELTPVLKASILGPVKQTVVGGVRRLRARGGTART
jgi:SAM-dependent methyltransferase